MNTLEPDRVRRHTAPEVLHQIDKEIEQRVQHYAGQPAEAITRRIENLEREWDMERWLETNASILSLSGALLGLGKSRSWLLLTCGVMGFLFQHALMGWCPPVPIFRRLGIRTRSEIDREKYALKAVRGDFENIPLDRTAPESVPVREILRAVTL